ncbi:hypothetical protein [Pseudomonas sp. S9]|uniref:hypothetical protein n=1 Tax=Pseudomonas sp. S9 TaxID=686578 RepID=UPI000255685E|nr:hypothetical protein [Pseudomonas sp. S9]
MKDHEEALEVFGYLHAVIDNPDLPGAITDEANTKLAQLLTNTTVGEPVTRDGNYLIPSGSWVHPSLIHPSNNNVVRY